MSLAEYIAKVADHVTPEDAELRLVQSRVDKVLAAAREFAPIAEAHPAGSYAKRTMLKNRKEADIVAILANAPNDRTLGSLAAHLERTLAGHARSVSSTFKAIRVDFADGVSVDFLPVARAGRTPDGPSVPRKLRHALSGIEHVKWAKREIHGSPRHGATRAFKHLRNVHGDLAPLSSFAIEVACVAFIPFNTRGLDSAFRLALNGLADCVERRGRLADPANSNNDLLADLAYGTHTIVGSRLRTAFAALNGHRPEHAFSG